MAIRHRPLTLLNAGGVVMLAAIGIAAAVVIASLRDNAVANSERETRNIALILAEQMDRAFQSVTLVQANIIDHIASQNLTTRGSFGRAMGREQTHTMLRERTHDLPQINAITLIDADGKVINFSRYWPTPDVNVADRDYFKALKSNPEAKSFVSEPVRNDGTGAWMIYLAHRVTTPDGQFLGVVLGEMELAYFEKLFGSIALLGDAGIAMFRLDGTLLARYPHIEQAISKNFRDGPLFQTVLLPAGHGVTRITSPVDGTDRIVAAQTLRHYPVAIAAATSVDAALAGWRYEARILVGAAILVATLVVVIVWLVGRRIQHSRRAFEQEIDAHKRHLDTAVSNMSQGLVMFDASTRIVTCNRRYLEMYGLAEDMVRPGLTVHELISHRRNMGSFAGDVDRYCDELKAAIARGATTSSTIETTDGRSIYIVNQPLADGGWVATHEDITERLKAERERDENQKFLDLVIEHVPSAILVKDAVTRQFILTNRAVDKLWSFDRAEAIGKTPHELFPKAQADVMTARDNRVLEGDGLVSFEEHGNLSAPDEERILTSKRLAVRDDDGRPKYLVTVIEDVTEQRRAERERDRNQEFLDLLIENVPSAITVKDAATRRFVLVNRAADRLLSHDRADVLGKTVYELFAKEPADLMTARDDETIQADGPVFLDAHPISMSRDSGRLITTNRLTIRGEDGQPKYLVAVIDDVTERHRIQVERDRAKEFLDLIIDNVPSTIIVKDAVNRRYLLINKAGERYYGIPRETMVGHSADEVLPPETAGQVAELDRGLLASRQQPVVDEHTLTMVGHGPRTVLSKRLCIRGSDGEPRYILVVIDDITQQKEADDKVAYLAYHDALTGLPNRVLFRERLENELARGQQGGSLALHYLDLDHFKGINDTLGHSLGDELLMAVAERLKNCLRDSDLVARLGGDEFAVVQTDLGDSHEATVLAQRLRDEVAGAPYEVNGHQLVVDVSVGIALAPDDGTNADQLLSRADMALYGAKADGRGGYRYFEPEMDARMKKRRALEMDLREALQNGELDVYYQPQIDLRTNAVSGCEALLRWKHPVRGMIGPAEFIPIAEETGMIVPIGEWVLRQACSEAAAWGDNLKVAVNLSPVQIKSTTLTMAVATILAETGLAPGRLEFEITESVLMHSNESNLGVLHLLRELGVRFAMDDFGTGYSSLSYLRSFPFDKIKIDRSFISDLSSRADSRKIVETVVTLAQGLGMVTTAEGVETEEQRAALRAIGCDQIQGYLVSAPQPADVVMQFLRTRSRARTNVA